MSCLGGCRSRRGTPRTLRLFPRSSARTPAALLQAAEPSAPRRQLPLLMCRAFTLDQSIVNAMMELPRLESIWTLPPAATTTYCLPPTPYEDGGALTPAPALKFHSTLPLVAS